MSWASGFPASDWNSCAPGACPADDISFQDRYMAASLGPQPGTGVCPECGIAMYGSEAWFDLVVALTQDYPDGTMFTEPHLYLTDGTSTWYLGGLADFEPATDWSPGAAFVIKELTLPEELDVPAVRDRLRASQPKRPSM
jgi:hypothetical protein